MSDAPRKIKVAYVINSILAAGAETMVLEVVSHLDKTKFEPTVYALRDYGQERTSLLKRFEEASVPIVFLKPGARLGIFDSLFILRRLFLTEHPDVVHCHLPDAVIAGAISAMLTRVPFIIHEHQAQKFHSWKIRLLYRLVRPFAALSLCYALNV